MRLLTSFTELSTESMHEIESPTYDPKHKIWVSDQWVDWWGLFPTTFYSLCILMYFTYEKTL